jgi:hypothetical protein
VSERLFTLRGKVEGVADGALMANHNLLDYVSPDRTKAWKIEAAWMWPVNYRATAPTDGFLCFTACLATDVLDHPQFEHILDPSDNRLCGWAMQTYNLRDATQDFITPNGVPLHQMEFLVDPDHLVSKELYINFASTSDDDNAPERDWGYMVLLREMKVTPTESIFAQIKGMGQDVSPLT